MALAGVAMFLCGVWINTQADGILRSLRDASVADDRGYKIPRGGMFEYVSGANFFGEIVEWCAAQIILCNAGQACGWPLLAFLAG